MLNSRSQLLYPTQRQNGPVAKSDPKDGDDNDDDVPLRLNRRLRSTTGGGSLLWTLLLVVIMPTFSASRLGEDVFSFQPLSTTTTTPVQRSSTVPQHDGTRRYFEWLAEFFGGDERLPNCYAQQMEEGGWRGHASTSSGMTLPPRDSNLPTFVFVAGTEGSGHHTLEELAGVIRSYYDVENTTTSSSNHTDHSHEAGKTKHILVDLRPHLMPVVHQEGRDKKSAYAAFFKDSVRDRLQSYSPLVQLQKKAAINGRRAIFFDSQDAYPFGADDPYRYADLTHLRQLHLDGILDLKVILLSRDPTNATLSNNRRMFHGNAPVERQARLMENAMTFLSASVSQLPCDTLMIWPFELFVSNPQTSLVALADFLDLDQEVFAGTQGEEIANMAARHGSKEVKYSPLGKVQDHTYRRQHVFAKHCIAKLSLEEQSSAKCGELMKPLLDDFFRVRRGQWPMLRPQVDHQ